MSYKIVRTPMGDLNASGMSAGQGAETDGSDDTGIPVLNPEAVNWPSPAAEEPDMTGTGTRVVAPSSGGSSYTPRPSTSAKPMSNAGMAIVGLLVVGAVGYLWLS